MLYREVPKNGDKLSILGYGCMRFPGKRQSINEKEAEKQILLGIDMGINYFDTAVPYHNGKSEPFLGKVLSKNRFRQKIKIATKLPHWSTLSIKEMEKILDEQLKKLQTDIIDYYLVHNLNGKTWEEAKQKGIIEFLDRALKNGKIINAGFSYHGASEDFNTVVDEYDWTMCQIQYNYLDTENQAGKAGLTYAASKGLAVVIMEPLRGGNLAKTPPPDVQKIWQKAENLKTPVEWSLGWIWNHPEVTSVLSGMNDQTQINENVQIACGAVSNSMSPKELSLVEEAAGTFRKVMKVGCTGCQYCMPCPSGVNIPYCFDIFNSYHSFKDKNAKLIYLLVNGGIFTPESTFASQCNECGRCLAKCPQNLPIPDILMDVKNDMEGFLVKPLIWLFKKVLKVKKKKT